MLLSQVDVVVAVPAKACQTNSSRSERPTMKRRRAALDIVAIRELAKFNGPASYDWVSNRRFISFRNPEGDSPLTLLPQCWQLRKIVPMQSIVEKNRVRFICCSGPAYIRQSPGYALPNMTRLLRF
jgi:hypothetical protein